MLPPPKKILSRLSAFDRTEDLLRPGDRILAAVSGGSDSVCMAHHCHRLSQRRGLHLTILHMHHGLRGKEADKDAELVRELAQRLACPFVIRELRVKELAVRERRSLEDAGRKLRYRTAALVARRLGCGKIATGHQLDDQAETLILHLLRGTKAKGLAGIPPKRFLMRNNGPGPGIQVIRPILAITRAEVEAYCRAYDLPFRTDRTNKSPRFTRNWVRKKVLPLLERRNPSIRENLAAIASDVRRKIH